MSKNTPIAHRPLIMGVLNVTPDSFSDGGKYEAVQSAVSRAFQLQAQGADIIDVGGESTRPGSQRLSAEEECARILPVIRAYLAQCRDEGVQPLPISVDTYHAATAEAAVAAGALIVNDVTGGQGDKEMGKVVAQLGTLYVCQHMRGTPGNMDLLTNYAPQGGVTAGVELELKQRTEAILQAGVRKEQVIWDIGLGFAKNAEQSWELLRNLDRFVAGDFPVLVGASRKRFLALTHLLDAKVPASARDVATSVVSVYCAQRGAWAVRVHDVPGTLQAINTCELLDPVSHLRYQRRYERFYPNLLLEQIRQRYFLDC